MRPGDSPTSVAPAATLKPGKTPLANGCQGGYLSAPLPLPTLFPGQPTSSTAAPWIWPRRKRFRASLAASRRKRLDLGFHRHPGGQGQKFLAVAGGSGWPRSGCTRSPQRMS